MELNDFSNSESLCHCDASHQVSAQSNTVWEKMSFEEFQNGHYGGHLRFLKKMILAILNLYVTLMSPIKFWLNLTWFGRRCRLKNYKVAALLERNNFSNSESLCHCDASHQVLAQSDLRLGRRCCSKNFKMATISEHLGYQNRAILAILNICVAHQVFNQTYNLGEVVV